MWNIRLFSNLLVMLLFSGCFAKPYTTTIPTISNQKGWTLSETCLYRGCQHIHDKIVSDDLSVTIQADRHILSNDDIFVITVALESKSLDKVTFSPANSTAKLESGRIIHARGFLCSQTIHSHSTYLSTNGLLTIPQELKRDHITNNKSGCFNLYFPTSPPFLEEQFELQIGEVTINNKTITLPKMLYSKGKRSP